MTTIPFERKSLPGALLDVLRDHLKIEAGRVGLDAQIAPRAYQQVKDLVERLGGVYTVGGAWDLPGAPDLLDAVLTAGKWPRRFGHDFVATPPHTAEWAMSMVDWHFEVGTEDYVLDACAGHGALTKALHPRLATWAATPWPSRTWLVEFDPRNVAVLQPQGLGTVVEGDFLQWTMPPEVAAAGGFRAIVSNPPWTTEENPTVFLDHLRHAASMLAPEGILLGLVPASFGTLERYAKARRALAAQYDMYLLPLPAGAFAESGTGVQGMVVTLDRVDQIWRTRPYGDWSSWYACELILTIENTLEHAYDAQQIAAKVVAGTLPTDLLGTPLPPTQAAMETLIRAALPEMQYPNMYAAPPAVWTSVLTDLLARWVEEYREHGPLVPPPTPTPVVRLPKATYRTSKEYAV